MPNVWDAQLVGPNLLVLANLRNAANGTKVSVGTNGRLTAQPPGFKQSWNRTFSKDSVSSFDNFLQPISKLFAAGVDSNASESSLTNALDGLKWLANHTYNGDATKKAALNRAIKLCDGVIKAGASFEAEHEGLVEFRNNGRWKQYCTFPVSMGQFLKKNDVGVCYAFSIDWIRRREIKKKSSYSTSKRVVGPRDQTQLSTLDKARLVNKVARIKVAQTEIDKGNMYEVKKSFGVAKLRNKRWGGPEKAIKDNDDGGDLYRNIVDLANSTGSFVVHWKGKINMKEMSAEGHAVGLYVDEDESLWFFDSNLGEYHFPKSALEIFFEMTSELWKKVYKGNYRAWELEYWYDDSDEDL